MHHPAKYYDAVSALPDAVRSDLEGRVKHMAGPSDARDGGDTGLETRPNHKLLRVVESDGGWFVWYLHGGRGVHIHVLAYSLMVSGYPPKPAPPALEANLVTSSPCTATDALLDGVLPASDGDW
jgi:hypothetical protein